MRLLLDLLKTIGISFLIFFLLNNLIRAFFEGEDSQRVIDIVWGIVFYVFYVFAFYLMHARKSADDYSLTLKDEKYSFSDDIKAIMSGEGKYLAIILGVLAAVFAIAEIVPVYFLTTILMPIFPIRFIVAVPVLSAVLGWIIITPLSVLVIAYGHYRVHVLRKQGKI